VLQNTTNFRFKYMYIDRNFNHGYFLRLYRYRSADPIFADIDNIGIYRYRQISFKNIGIGKNGVKLAIFDRFRLSSTPFRRFFRELFNGAHLKSVALKHFEYIAKTTKY